jgi:hypothetical protein
MHDDATIPQIPRYIPFKRGGWGVALFICALAVVTALAAYYVHKRTYLPPTDVRNHSIGGSSSHE